MTAPLGAMRQAGEGMTKAAFFSFLHPLFSPGGAQTIARRLFEAHEAKHGRGSALFIGANIGEGPKRSPGTNLLQVGEFDFLYVTPNFDHVFGTNFDVAGQVEMLELLDSFAPDVLHFHHFLGFGVDFIQACLARFPAPSVLTIHEHLLVCHNDGHLLQKKNNHICLQVELARCAACLPEYRYDYFPQRMQHFKRVVEQFDVVTAVSRFTAGVIEQAMDLAKPIVVVPNGPVAPVPAQAGQIIESGTRPVRRTETTMPATVARFPLRDLHIAFIGQIHPAKGLHLLLDALVDIGVECKDERWLRNTKLTIFGAFVGNSAYSSDIETKLKTAEAMNLKVSLAGPYDSQDLSRLLHDCNVVVVPSLWPESYCLTADEAVGLGKVLVCSDFPAIRERFQNGNLVRLFPMGVRAALGQALVDLMTRPDGGMGPGADVAYLAQTDVYEAYAAHYG
jgi:glycosyltransferase involved in cell wall biosynthesis